MTERAIHPYGSIRDAVIEWIDNFPEGKEFYYGDIAADLGVQLPTVSATVLKMARADNPVITRGSKAGWYVKPDPEQAAMEAEAAAPRKGLRPGDRVEVVGLFKDGNALLRADDGTLWRAEEM